MLEFSQDGDCYLVQKDRQVAGLIHTIAFEDSSSSYCSASDFDTMSNCDCHMLLIHMYLNCNYIN